MNKHNAWTHTRQLCLIKKGRPSQLPCMLLQAKLCICIRDTSQAEYWPCLIQATLQRRCLVGGLRKVYTWWIANLLMIVNGNEDLLLNFRAGGGA